MEFFHKISVGGPINDQGNSPVNLRGNILQKISLQKFLYKKPPQLVLHMLCLLIMTHLVSKRVSLNLLKIKNEEKKEKKEE